MEPLLLQAVLSGLLVGSVLALLSAGFGLVWGATGTINISHTAFSVAAAYLAYWLTSVGPWGFFLALIAAPLLAFALGVLTYRSIVRPAAVKVRDLGLVTLVSTLGIGVALENSLAAVWGPGPRVLSLAVAAEAISVFDVSLPVGTLLAASFAWLGLVALWFFLYRTYTGKAVRAVWQDSVGAALYGIDRDRVTDVAFGVATATAALAGVSMALIYAFSPAAYIEWLIWAFLIVIVGGVGSLLGTFIAGLLVGVVSTTVGLWVPFSWLPAILFAFLIGVVLWRPTGLFRI
jgi:branched-chain amino acid transport system permease protein